ncbi:MAG: hypothetical protein GXO43_07905 [Crenarchaeota archaeon]|nr:hypothetical protein [Thermoproteota archaeon]
MRARTILAPITAAIMLLDNVTIIFSNIVRHSRTKPHSIFFLSNPFLYVCFSIFKILAAAYLTYRFVENKEALLVWAIVMFFFIRAIIMNTVNWLA